MRSLVQSKFMQGKRLIEILEEGKVRVTHSTATEKTEEVLDLFNIAPEPDRYFYRPVKFLVVAVLFLSPTIFFLAEAIRNSDTSLLVLSALFVVPAAISVQQYFHGITDLLVYRFRTNGTAAIKLWNELPDADTFSSFQYELVKSIKSLRVHPELDGLQKLKIYKNSIEFLLDEGVISAKEATMIFDRNKERLLGKTKAKLVSIRSREE